jgi:hypothetical protein
LRKVRAFQITHNRQLTIRKYLKDGNMEPYPEIPVSRRGCPIPRESGPGQKESDPIERRLKTIALRFLST